MAKNKIVFTWGRFNPPTIGHGVVMDRVAAEAKSRGADFKIYASKSEDPRKNPLTFKDKIKFLKKSFPKYSRNVDSNARLNTILTVMASLQKKYSEVVVIVGSDRVQEFNKLLHVYNGREYDFEKINVVSAGERDPDAEGVAGMSASKMRKAAADGDYKSFKKGTPIKKPKELYDSLRKSMQIREEYLSFMEEIHDPRSVKGKRFNQMLRFGLVPMKYYSITIRAFKDLEKSGPSPELRKHIFNVSDKVLEYIMNDDLLYRRFLVLLHQDFLDIYQEEQRDALLDKSQKSGIDFTALLEVYMRGLASSPIYGKTPAQYAFDRVNSFVSGGHARKNLDSDIWEKCHLQESENKKMKKFSQLDPFHKGPNKKKPAAEWGTKEMADRYSKVTPGQSDDIGEATSVNKAKIPVYVEDPRAGKTAWQIIGYVSKQATSIGATKVSKDVYPGRKARAEKTIFDKERFPAGPGWQIIHSSYDPTIKDDTMTAPKKRFNEFTQEIDENVDLKSVGTYFDTKKLVTYPMQNNNKPDMSSAVDVGDVSTEWVKSLSKKDLVVVRKAVKKDRAAARHIEDALKESVDIEEAPLNLGKVHLPPQKTVMAINRKLKADAPEVLKDYRKLLKDLQSSFAVGKEIVYIRDEPKESYRKKTGFGNAHRVVMRDRTKSPLGKEVVYHKGSMETTYDTVLAFTEEYIPEGVASRSRRAFSKIRTDTINQAADKNRKQKPIPTSVKKRVADDLARQKKFRQKNRQAEEIEEKKDDVQQYKLDRIKRTQRKWDKAAERTAKTKRSFGPEKKSKHSAMSTAFKKAKNEEEEIEEGGMGGKGAYAKNDPQGNRSGKMKNPYTVRYAKAKAGPIQSTVIDGENAAKKFLSDVKKQGMNGMIVKGLKEEEVDEKKMIKVKLNPKKKIGYTITSPGKDGKPGKVLKRRDVPGKKEIG